MHKAEGIKIIDKTIEFIRLEDSDKPYREHFSQYHLENSEMIKDLKKLRKYVRSK